MSESMARPPFDANSPAISRRYDYWQNGKDNFAADRASGDKLRAAFPTMHEAVRENRRFMERSVQHLAADCGVRQFIDVGVGRPGRRNVHEIAQEADPTALVVYVDNDPLVVVHARALLTGSPEGLTVGVEADLRDPATILAEASKVLDFEQPIALLMIAVLHFIPDTDDPYGAVRELVDALPAGSYVALSHGTFDPVDADIIQLVKREVDTGAHGPVHPRKRQQVEKFLTGLRLLPPGVVPTIAWQPHLHPEPDPKLTEADVATWAAVAHVNR